MLPFRTASNQFLDMGFADSTTSNHNMLTIPETMLTNSKSSSSSTMFRPSSHQQQQQQQQHQNKNLTGATQGKSHRLNLAPTTGRQLNLKRLMHFDPRTLGIAGLTAEFLRILLNVFLAYQIPADLRDSAKVSAPRGILLYGEPGTGKTTIAKALCRLLMDEYDDQEPEVISAADIYNQALGASEARIRQIFEPAFQYMERVKRGEVPDRPMVFIIDEIDAVGAKRVENQGGGDGVATENKVLAEFLSILDGMKTCPNILVIGMTNRIDAVDPAILRSGRLSLKIHIPLPTWQGRCEIFALKLQHLFDNGHLDLHPQDLHRLAHSTMNFTGADIEEVVREATVACIRENITSIISIMKSNPLEHDIITNQDNDTDDLETEESSITTMTDSNNYFTSSSSSSKAPKKNPIQTKIDVFLKHLMVTEDGYRQSQSIQNLQKKFTDATKISTVATITTSSSSTTAKPFVYYTSGTPLQPQLIDIPWCPRATTFTPNNKKSQRRPNNYLAGAVITLEDALRKEFDDFYNKLPDSITKTIHSTKTSMSDLTETYLRAPAMFARVQSLATIINNIPAATTAVMANRFADIIKVRYRHLENAVEIQRTHRGMATIARFQNIRALCMRHEQLWKQIQQALHISTTYFRKFVSIWIQAPSGSGRTNMMRSILENTSCRALFPVIQFFDVALESISITKQNTLAPLFESMYSRAEHMNSPSILIVDGLDHDEENNLIPIQTFTETMLRFARGSRYADGAINLSHPFAFVIMSSSPPPSSSKIDIHIDADLSLINPDEMKEAAAVLQTKHYVLQNLDDKWYDDIFRHRSIPIRDLLMAASMHCNTESAFN